MSPLVIEYLPVDQLRPSPRNARMHSEKQLSQIAASITEHGNVNPILADESCRIIAGHGRLEAAKKIGLRKVPVIVLRHLTETQQRTLMLADNKIASNAGWDFELLAAELGDLIADDDIDLAVTGFSAPEIDQILLDHEDDTGDPGDDHPELPDVPISKRGDLWLLGRHRLLCGDAREPDDLARLCGADRAAMAFLDPPYNVDVRGIVGRGKIKHGNFAMGSGEMSRPEFSEFLSKTLRNAAHACRESAIHFVCMDWRSIDTLMDVGRQVYAEALNINVWVKSNAGQGSFYRSQHEMIGVFRVGDTPHLNNVELGKHGRNRSNVWHYAGVNSFSKGRLDDLSVHPTVKPVAMIADAIKDCTRRGDIVLDCFAGSGTTMLACERVGRRARSLEYDPRYVDVAIRRWQAFTRRDAVHSEAGITFDTMANRNAAEVK